MFNDFVVDSVLLFFPFLIYCFFLSVHYNINDKKEIFALKIIIILSILALLKFGSNQLLILSLINIPIFISLEKKYYYLTIALMFLPIIFNIGSIFNVIVLMLSYLFLYIINIFIRKHEKILFIFMAIESITLFILYNNIISVLLFIISIFILVMLYRKMMLIISFNNNYKELEKENEIKKSLFKITHEIKNPIAVIKAYLDMFDTNDTLKSKKYINILKNETSRLLCLLEDFSLVNKLVVNCDIMDFCMLIEDNIDGIKQALNDKKINIEYNSRVDEAYIMGDYNRLSQVMINVIKNSIEANPKNIYINLDINDKNVVLNIDDDGYGIEESVLKRIKEPFYTTKINGTGLGVSLSNEIILAHSGKINYTSTYGKGTNVKIEIPVYDI